MRLHTLIILLLFVLIAGCIAQDKSKNKSKKSEEGTITPIVISYSATDIIGLNVGVSDDLSKSSTSVNVSLDVSEDAFEGYPPIIFAELVNSIDPKVAKMIELEKNSVTSSYEATADFDNEGGDWSLNIGIYLGDQNVSHPVAELKYDASISETEYAFRSESSDDWINSALAIENISTIGDPAAFLPLIPLGITLNNNRIIIELPDSTGDFYTAVYAKSQNSQGVQYWSWFSNYIEGSNLIVELSGVSDTSGDAILIEVIEVDNGSRKLMLEFWPHLSESYYYDNFKDEVSPFSVLSRGVFQEEDNPIDISTNDILEVNSSESESDVSVEVVLEYHSGVYFAAILLFNEVVGSFGQIDFPESSTNMYNLSFVPERKGLISVIAFFDDELNATALLYSEFYSSEFYIKFPSLEVSDFPVIQFEAKAISQGLVIEKSSIDTYSVFLKSTAYYSSRKKIGINNLGFSCITCTIEDVTNDGYQLSVNYLEDQSYLSMDIMGDYGMMDNTESMLKLFMIKSDERPVFNSAKETAVVYQNNYKLLGDGIPYLNK